LPRHPQTALPATIDSLMQNASQSSATLRVTEKDLSVQRVSLPADFNRSWIEEHGLLQLSFDTDIYLDFKKTRYIDSAGASFITFLQRELSAHGHRLSLAEIPAQLLETLEKWTDKVPDIVPLPKRKPSWIVLLGDQILSLRDELVKAFALLSEMIYWSTLGLFKRRGFRKGALGDQMYQLGFNALGIVALLAFLIGVVLALQTAIQLKMFGADIFLAPMIGISMIRELGPLMTAIILAGRTGSATTAEIATMGVQEELDALQTMAINPIQFVVVPKFWAITLTMPLLSIIAVGAGIFGGYLVAVMYLDLASALFWSELAKNIFFKDFIAGFLKSIVFAWLIIWIGAYYGFKVRGGAEEVGKETTAAVVTGIFVIIIADAIFSFVI
jgi:phospholipid/cholesterol/gamma-HCH transport system permease protein